MRTDAQIEALVRSFEDLTLPRPEWTHHAHLTVALWYLRRHPRPEATRRIREGRRADSVLSSFPGVTFDDVWSGDRGP